MRKVTCQECGRTYDCDKEDLCPKCGSFNYAGSSSSTKLERDLLARFDGVQRAAPRYTPKSTGAAVEGRHRHGARIEDCEAKPKFRAAASNPTRITPDQTRPAKSAGEKKKPNTVKVMLIVIAAAVLMNVLPMLFFRLRWLLSLY